MAQDREGGEVSMEENWLRENWGWIAYLLLVAFAIRYSRGERKGRMDHEPPARPRRMDEDPRIVKVGDERGF